MSVYRRFTDSPVFFLCSEAIKAVNKRAKGGDPGLEPERLRQCPGASGMQGAGPTRKFAPEKVKKIHHVVILGPHRVIYIYICTLLTIR